MGKRFIEKSHQNADLKLIYFVFFAKENIIVSQKLNTAILQFLDLLFGHFIKYVFLTINHSCVTLQDYWNILLAISV